MCGSNLCNSDRKTVSPTSESLKTLRVFAADHHRAANGEIHGNFVRAARKTKYIASLKDNQRITETMQYIQAGSLPSQSSQSSGMNDNPATHPLIVRANPAVTPPRRSFSFWFAQTEHPFAIPES